MSSLSFAEKETQERYLVLHDELGKMTKDRNRHRAALLQMREEFSIEEWKRVDRILEAHGVSAALRETK